ncbi:CvpA family protein [Peribacillus kribbensis]|uniref:CvpA family protein n=1 Tax=Peribacillus kribbensis TaxID=356658 RepID=UPI0003FCEB75|nr:CvpA family protein [Peribacillus kribbensis]
MLDLIIIVILLMGLIVGLKRGFILQLVHLTGFAAAFIAAWVYYNDLAPKLKLWIPFPTLGDTDSMKMIFHTARLDDAYYNAIAFAIIFFGVKIIWQLIGSMLDFIAHIPIIKQLNRLGGGILGFVEVYLLIFILLYIAALVPVESIQNPLNHSFMATAMVKDTPVLSSMVKELWFKYNPM